MTSPSPQITALSNGLRVVTDHIPHVPSVSLGVWVNVGSRNEPAEINGAAHFLEHMAFKGTKTRTALQIAQQIENVGGHMNAYTSRENTAYYMRMLKENTNQAIEILADILQNSTFIEEEFAREREVILQEIGQSNDAPEDIICDYFQSQCFPDQPVGRPILGTVDIIKNISSQQVKGYMDKNYGAKQMVFAAAGNVNHDEIVAKVERHFDQLKPSGTVEKEKAIYHGGDFRMNKDLEQVHIMLGFPSVTFLDENNYVASILSTILGSGMSSRLFQEVREKRGLVYSIYSSRSIFSDNGLFEIYAGTGEDEVAKLMPVICEEIKKATSTITQAELDRAKAQSKASYLMGLENTSNRCERLGMHLTSYGRVIDGKEVTDKIDAVTIDDIHKLAFKTFTAKPTFAALGPINNVLPYDKICEALKF